jgi:hypothetical protein
MSPLLGRPAMSASGPKQTSLVALHMSAFGGKAEMMRSATFKSFPLERSSRLTEFVPKVGKKKFWPRRDKSRAARPSVAAFARIS